MGQRLEPTDVLSRPSSHQQIELQWVLRVRNTGQPFIGQVGPIHFTVAAVHQQHTIGTTTPTAEILEKGEEAAITATPQPATSIVSRVDVTVSPTPTSNGIRSAGIRCWTRANRSAWVRAQSGH